MTGLVLIVVSVPACGRPQSPLRQFELRGQILAVRADHEVLIKHEDIKGFMPAMTMPYKVRQPELLRGKAPGDLVTATLVVSDTDAWLTRLEKTGSAPMTDPAPEPAPTARVPLLRAGDPAPPTPLTDDGGNPFTLHAWRGSAVAITFIYLRCPLPQFCPLMDRRFADVQRLAGSDADLKGRVRLLSVSFDPDSDTPAALRAHAARLAADPAVWRFATAPRAVVDDFAAAFGVNVIRERDRTITHNLRTAVIDPRGRVVAIHDGSEWTAQQIVDDLRLALSSR